MRIKICINISELQNFSGTLKEFKEIVDNLVVEYGNQSFISFEASHNNVDVTVQTV
jgi:hypothetical protein